MAERRLGIVFNGATGELARRQHLPGLLAMVREGGLALSNGDRLVPDLLLVGRSAERLAPVARALGVERWTTDLDAALASPDHPVFFDAGATGGRVELAHRAIAAGKHVYIEKPVARDLAGALGLLDAARRAGVKHGTVQDKLFLPGFAALRGLIRSGALGRLLELRLEMGRWIFDGFDVPGQRPSWNYRKADGGGLILDMFPHWRYMLDGLAGEVRSVSAVHRTQVPRRVDEHGQPYEVDVEDAVFAKLELEGGVIASVNSSWATRVRRDAGIQVQVDGTLGSAVGGPFECWVQTLADTPKGAIASAIRQTASFFDQWTPVPVEQEPVGSYRAGWELFLRHVAEDAPFPYSLLEGAKGVQLAEAAYRSHLERRWVDLPSLG
ncbi:Gfo/Idh/MocA family protein [Falsiroseomonas sp. CW058]|uniref:Gfo/Idh/MocA family protein n=1 Tax=Falsiroseomonas sp. CW058 TaxID=3388664 RepID=UPI003D311386